MEGMLLILHQGGRSIPIQAQHPRRTNSGRGSGSGAECLLDRCKYSTLASRDAAKVQHHPWPERCPEYCICSLWSIARKRRSWEPWEPQQSARGLGSPNGCQYTPCADRNLSRVGRSVCQISPLCREHRKYGDKPFEYGPARSQCIHR